jgi:tRNA 2-thiouridine synthesizing protein C
MASLLIRFTQSPYGSGFSQDGLDFALAATNYGHTVHVLFEGEGVLQLVQTASTKGIKNHSKRLASMPLFDIEECFICKDSVDAFAIDSVLLNTGLIEKLEGQLLSASQRLALIQRADHVVTF